MTKEGAQEVLDCINQGSKDPNAQIRCVIDLCEDTLNDRPHPHESSPEPEPSSDDSENATDPEETPEETSEEGDEGATEAA